LEVWQLQAAQAMATCSQRLAHSQPNQRPTKRVGLSHWRKMKQNRVAWIFSLQTGQWSEFHGENAEVADENTHTIYGTCDTSQTVAP
jgi:hypothetical protein